MTFKSGWLGDTSIFLQCRPKATPCEELRDQRSLDGNATAVSVGPIGLLALIKPRTSTTAFL